MQIQKKILLLSFFFFLSLSLSLNSVPFFVPGLKLYSEMPAKHSSDSDDDRRPRTKAEIEGDEFEDKLDHQRGGVKKGIEQPSHQSKPKSVRS